MFRMQVFYGLVLATAAGAGIALGAGTEEKTATPESVVKRVTHKQTLTISIPRSHGNSLTTMALLSDGRVAALVGPPRYQSLGGKSGDNKPVHEVRIYDGQGKLQNTLPLSFAGQAVTGAPDGIMYVAGDGRLAKFSADGKQLQDIPLPYIDSLLKDKETIEKQARQMVESQKKQLEAITGSFSKQVEVLEKRIAELKEKPEKDRTSSESRRLQRYESQLEGYKSQLESYRQAYGSELKIEAVVQSLTQRARTVNSLAATPEYVFVVCGDMKGHGYATWRMDTEFKTSKQVLTGLRGCCGQMDVKAHDGKLFVAENCSHQVGVYDYDGKEVKKIGKRGGIDGFGSCCNPMNLCIGPGGDVFTAESEGIIRQFTSTGDQVALVGKANLSGGCKNVAVGVSPKGDQVYFCDLPGSQIIVLAPVTDAKEAESLARKVHSELEPKQPVVTPPAKSGATRKSSTSAAPKTSRSSSAFRTLLRSVLGN